MRFATYELNNKKKIIQAHFCKQDKYFQVSKIP